MPDLSQFARLHGPVSRLIGNNNRKLREFRLLESKFRSGAETPLLDALSTGRFRSAGIHRAIILLALDWVGRDPGKCIALIEALGANLGGASQCIVSSAYETLAVAAVGRSQGETYRESLYLARANKDPECPFCDAAALRTEAQWHLRFDLDQASSLLAMAAARLERAKLSLPQEDQLVIDLAVTRIMKGQALFLASESGAAAALAPMRESVEELLRVHDVPVRTLKMAFHALLTVLIATRKPQELKEAKALLPRLKRMGFAGAERARLDWQHGLLIGRTRKSDARKILLRARSALDQLELKPEAAAVTADLAALEYPNRQRIIEAIRSWASEPAESLRPATGALWRLLASPEALREGCDVGGRVAEAIAALRTACEERMQDPPPRLIEC